MSKTNRIPQKLVPWVEARRRFKLSDARVQMARELGLNPRKLGKLANYKQQPWKVPLPAYIERLYEKQFGRSRPERVQVYRGTGPASTEEKRRLFLNT